MTPSLKLPASSPAADRVMMTVEAAKLIQQPIPGSPMAAALPLPRIIKSQATFPTTHQKRKTSRIKVYPAASRPIYTVSVAEQRTGVSEDKREAVSQTKRKLYQALEGINRGVFGVTSAKRIEIAGLVKELESQNPTVNPTSDLEKVSGCWKLVYSTITILGSKRTKLGLRDFITLGDFLQIIDTAQSKAVNVIKFSARALNLLTGELTIEATFDIASSSRVNIRYSNSNIRPDKLMNVFSRNYHLLLSIFNPEGWLEITYLDDTMRIGRDDRDNVFILERCADEIAGLRTSS